MSIIYDALKKVESSSNKEIPAPEARISGAKPGSRVKVYLIYLSVVCLGLLLGNVFFLFLSHKKMDTETVQVEPPALVKAPADNQLPVVVQQPVDTKKENTSVFTLNGVFFSQNQGYALINNRIAKVGDTIAGATVKSIDLDEVELERSGVTFKINSKVN